MKKETYHYYGQADADENIEERGVFKWYLVVLALVMFGGTIWNFIYLGGIEGILTSKMLPVEGARSYFLGLLSLIGMPIIGVCFLWLAFRKNKKYSDER